MNVGSSALPIVYLILGVILLSIIVSSLTVFLYGPKPTERTVVIERPWNNYKGWWGHYGAGLPGWGGPRYPPPPSPHPKPPIPSPPAPPATPPA
jgi:hypothetical protein